MNRAPDNRHFVQIERRASERAAKLMQEQPQAASLLFMLVRQMDKHGAVVASQTTLSEMQGVSLSTIKRAVSVLRNRNWVDVVRLGGKGGALAYAVNGRFAWADTRSEMPRRAYFQASVLAVEDEQDQPVDDRPPMEAVPTVMPGEHAVPTGDGMPPPSQPALEGLEPVVYRDSAGALYEHDPQTGELQQRIEDRS
jgi:DNA-binding transcriptional MocR family regulator